MAKRGNRIPIKNKIVSSAPSPEAQSSIDGSIDTQGVREAPPNRTFDTPVSATSNILNFVEDLKRQWMATIDALVDPLAIVGHDYKIQKANLAMARMSGRDVRDIVGKSCFEIFASRSSPCPGCQMLSVNGTSRTFELTNIRGDRYYEVTSQALLDHKGESEGFVQIYRDRTEARKMREQLAQQDKLASIGLLAGGIAHEINNPLGGILVFSQMLLRELPKDSSHYTDVVEIESATQRCKAIVESLLDFARQNPEGKPDKRAKFDVADAIRTALRFGEVSIPRRSRIEIITKLEDDAHPIVADRNKLIQVFLNLIQNAIQAMPDGGSLILRSETFKDALGKAWGRYHVEDTGVGIPAHNLKKIFDPFFTTKDPGEGTGLGLALCYGIIHDLGGTLQVESTVDQGTTFTIEVPLEGSASKPLQAS
jgi:two-component system NtrC family sensor kinase